MAELEVGKEYERLDGPITRKQIKTYGKVSKDRNPIHMSDDFAEQVGLNGVIAHGMLFFGFEGHLISDIAEEVDGEVVTVGAEMRGTVRPGDTVITKAKVEKVEDNVAHLSVEQWSKMPLKLEKDGEVIKVYEGEEKNWVKEKEKSGIATEETDEGILTYRKWISIKGKASIKF